MVPQLAVVSDMRVAEQQIVRADPSRQIRVGTAVDGAVFPENIVIADFQISGIAFEFQILRFPTDCGKWEKLVASTHFRVTFEDDVRMENAVITQFDVRANDAIWPDADIPPDGGKR